MTGQISIVFRGLATMALLALCACPEQHYGHLVECSDDSHCFQDSDFVCDKGETNTCLRGCIDNTDCLRSQHCDTTTTPDKPVCRHGQAAVDGGRPDGAGGGDPAAGDPAGGDTN